MKLVIAWRVENFEARPVDVNELPDIMRGVCGDKMRARHGVNGRYVFFCVHAFVKNHCDFVSPSLPFSVTKLAKITFFSRSNLT